MTKIKIVGINDYSEIALPCLIPTGYAKIEQIECVAEIKVDWD
ncbi:hypothetical protein [Ruegeria sp. A3M17]|nr:hypothetical protein [Ruegeria sp. A3M17]